MDQKSALHNNFLFITMRLMYGPYIKHEILYTDPV